MPPEYTVYRPPDGKQRVSGDVIITVGNPFCHYLLCTILSAIQMITHFSLSTGSKGRYYYLHLQMTKVKHNEVK